MDKLKKNTKQKVKYNNLLSENFREIVTKQIGKLDTATSFMYLYRRFGEPTYTNKDESKILCDYRFKHEDLLISVNASYHNCVYFSLHVPVKRFLPFQKKRKLFWQQLYKKYNQIPFMPYSSIPFNGTHGLNKQQNKKNIELIDLAATKFFSKRDEKYIEEQLKSKNPDRKIFKMLKPFENKLCEEFRKQLTKTELKELNGHLPKIEEIPGLKEQCLYVINEFKKGCWVRDVEINILGYKSKKNLITEFVNEINDTIKK